MIEYNQNETVTISLERYEELKRNQKPVNYFGDPKTIAINEYMRKNGLVLFYNPQNPAEIITEAEAKTREREIAVNDENWILKM